MSEEEMNTDDQSSNDPMEEDENSPTEQPSTEVYLPGKPLEEGEELVCDQSAYVMLHQAQTGSPCLSFDIIRDNLGDNRETFPLTSYLVAGTQAAQAHVNCLIVMKLSNLYQTNKEDKEDDESEEEEEEEDTQTPQMLAALIKHQGSINRTRVNLLNYCFVNKTKVNPIAFSVQT